MAAFEHNRLNPRTQCADSFYDPFSQSVNVGRLSLTVSVNSSTNQTPAPNSSTHPTLVFLPGLTADHHLFDKQVAHFESTTPILTWDAPGHAASRPFKLDFTLDDKARWLHDILALENITRPVFIGQSMGGYVSQMFMQLFPGQAAGFLSIDSAPLQRAYVSAAEIWMLKHTYTMFYLYPHKRLIIDGSRGNAESDYGRELMVRTIAAYDHKEYCRLSAHGFRILADAYESDRPFIVDCPVELICGEHDKAGTAKRYNIRWAEKTGYTLHMLPNAGHNSNTDQPEMVNDLIENLLAKLA